MVNTKSSINYKLVSINIDCLLCAVFKRLELNLFSQHRPEGPKSTCSSNLSIGIDLLNLTEKIVRSFFILIVGWRFYIEHAITE